MDTDQGIALGTSVTVFLLAISCTLHFIYKFCNNPPRNEQEEAYQPILIGQP
jgi:hypothetical protein